MKHSKHTTTNTPFTRLPNGTHMTTERQLYEVIETTEGLGSVTAIEAAFRASGRAMNGHKPPQAAYQWLNAGTGKRKREELSGQPAEWRRVLFTKIDQLHKGGQLPTVSDYANT